MARFLEELLDRYNHIYKTNIQEQDIKQWDLSCYPGMKELFLEPGFFKDLKPYPNTIEIIEQLYLEEFDIYICTNPMGNRNAMRDKTIWMERNLPFLVRENFVLTPVKLFGDVIFDDAPHYISDFPGCTIINDRPYNKSVKASYRIYNNDFNKFYNIIHKIKNKKITDEILPKNYLNNALQI